MTHPFDVVSIIAENRNIHCSSTLFSPLFSSFNNFLFSHIPKYTYVVRPDLLGFAPGPRLSVLHTHTKIDAEESG